MRTVIRLNEAERLKALVAEDAIVTQDSIYMRVRFASGEVKEHVAEDVEITPGGFALWDAWSSYVYWKDKGEWRFWEYHNSEEISGWMSGCWMPVPGLILGKFSNEAGTWCELISDGRRVASGGLGDYVNSPIKGGYFTISRYFKPFEPEPEIEYAFVLVYAPGPSLTTIPVRRPPLPLRTNAKLPFVVFIEASLAHKVMPGADGISSVEFALPEADEEFPFPELLDNGELLVAAKFLVSEQGVATVHPAVQPALRNLIVTSVGVGKDAVHLVKLINGPYALVYGDSVHQLRVPGVFYSDGERIFRAFEVDAFEGDKTVVIERLV